MKQSLFKKSFFYFSWKVVKLYLPQNSAMTMRCVCVCVFGGRGAMFLLVFLVSCMSYPVVEANSLAMTHQLSASTWHLITLWLTSELSQSVPTCRHASLGRWIVQVLLLCKQSMCLSCFQKQNCLGEVQIKPWVWTHVGLFTSFV